MVEIRGAALLIGLFALRCLVPLALTVAAGYLLTRLDKRWQAAARAEREAWTEVEESRERVRLPQPAAPRILPLMTAPCWVQKGCEPATRNECPAYLKPNGPCWSARLKAEGELPTSCVTCTLFAQDVGWEELVLRKEGEQSSLFVQYVGRD